MMESGSGSSWQDLFQALIKAKTQNILEDIKLRRELDMLETERLHMDKVHFNNIFEQKKAVYRMRLETLLMKLRAQERICKDVPVVTQSLPHAVLNQTGEEDREGADEQEHDQKEEAPTNDPGFETLSVASSSYLLPRGQTMRLDSRRDAARFQTLRRFSHSGYQPIVHTLHRGTRKAQTPSDHIKEDFAEVIERILNRGYEPPRQYQQAQSERRRRYDYDQEVQRPANAFRSKTFPELRQKTVQEPHMVNGRSKGVYVSGHWVGDPKAISSVRRSRKPPEELVARHRHKAVGEIRHLLNDVPGFNDCSRNCQRQARMDKVQAMCDSMPPVVLNVTQLKLLKQRAMMLEPDGSSWIAPSRPRQKQMNTEHVPPRSNQRKQQIQDRIKQLEDISKEISKADIIDLFDKHPRRSLVRPATDDGHSKSPLDDSS